MPSAAPPAVQAAIEAANSIATTPYIWGGGHGSFESSGYDCSGAVSFALNGGGFLDSPLDSTGLETWGEPGPGQWITVYANAGHAWMIIAGLAFDTVGGPGPRWHPELGQTRPKASSPATRAGLLQAHNFGRRDRVATVDVVGALDAGEECGSSGWGGVGRRGGRPTVPAQTGSS